MVGLNAYQLSPDGTLSALDALGFSDGSSQYPRCHHLALDAGADRVYVSHRENALSRSSFVAVVDSSDPRDLRELGSHVTEDQIEGITVHEGLLLVAAHDQGLIVHRRGEGAELTELARLPGIGNAWQVRAAGDVAYVADTDGGLVSVDLSDPAAPVLLHRLALPGAPKDLVLDGSRAFVALGAAGVALVSLADPRAPLLIEVEETPGSALAVAYGASVQALYVADWNDLRVFDASEPDDLRVVGAEPLPLGDGDESRTLGVAAADEVILSGNWTELVSYAYHPGRIAPDLQVAPRRAQLPSVAAGERATVLLRVANQGNAPLTLRGVGLGDESLEFSGFLEGRALEPGEELTAVLTRVDPDGEAFTSWIDLESDDPDQPRRCVAVRANGRGVNVGQPAGDRQWVSLEGDVISLPSLLGEGPVLLAYFATF